MILATDVRYDETARTARAAGVAFTRWADDRASQEWVVQVEHIEDYQPGSFFRRELPCLRALIDPLRDIVHTVVVDGHVWLGPGRPGLGHYLYEAFDGDIAVIGIAKSRFVGGYAREVVRGNSTRPLYVTTIGTDLDEACANLRAMHGPYRLPTLLKRVDRLSRGDEA